MNERGGLKMKKNFEKTGLQKPKKKVQKNKKITMKKGAVK